MNNQQLERMTHADGFIAALDQSGGSTPKALRLYGIPETAYNGDEDMFALVHQMRTRIIQSPSFTADKILAAILFKVTMNSKIDGEYTADYLWDKGIIPILKVDEGLAEETDGVQLMKPMKELDALLAQAKERHIFGTKMRSVIKELNEDGIRRVVAQQFDYARHIIAAGFVPIIEPEVDIHAKDKAAIEDILLRELTAQTATLKDDEYVMFKLTLPERANLYHGLLDYPAVIRIVALSGGYSRETANDKLRANDDVIASFSRALTEGLHVDMSADEFDRLLGESVDTIYRASVGK